MGLINSKEGAVIHTIPPGVRDEKRRIIKNDKFKDWVNWEKYGYETNGEVSQALVRVAPGGGTPPHFHLNMSEQFFPLKGTLGILLGNDIIMLEPGQNALVPRETTHRFFNPPDATEDIEFRVECRPASARFEQSIHLMYGLVGDDQGTAQGRPKSFVYMCLLTDMGDMSFPGPSRWLGLNVLISVVATYARWMGYEEELLKEYWD